VSRRPWRTRCGRPRVSAGSDHYQVSCRNREDAAGWTVASCDGGLTAHFEDTVCIRNGRAEVLMRLQVLTQGAGDEGITIS
jgi:hypothetical protein